MIGKFGLSLLMFWFICLAGHAVATEAESPVAMATIRLLDTSSFLDIGVVSIGSNLAEKLENPNEKRRLIPCHFVEQCALECYKSTKCSSYVFYEELNQCELVLNSTFNRALESDEETLQTISQQISCDLKKCSKSVYCSADKACLCDPTSTSVSEDCSQKVKYELSDWTEWSPCSTTCDEGFRQQKRFCTKVYFDPVSKSEKREILENQEWLCGLDLKLEDTYRIEKCMLAKCSFYSEWTGWSACNKICGGYRTRTRNCTLTGQNVEAFDHLCNSVYLNNVEVCEYDDCSAMVAYLEKTDKSVQSSVAKRGLLRFMSTVSNRVIRAFTYTNEKTVVEKIAKVTCTELGFGKLSSVKAIEASDLKTMYPVEAEYMRYVNSQNINGLKCDGDESTVKECSTSTNAGFGATLYELEVECIYDGFWSAWGPWSDCSKKCGMGAKTRTRSCSDPKPSFSEMSATNGSYCAIVSELAEVEVQSCVLQRCT